MIRPVSSRSRACFSPDLPQQKRRNDRWNKSDAHLGVAELRFGRGQGEVAERRQAAAAGDRRPVDRGNRDLGKFV